MKVEEKNMLTVRSRNQKMREQTYVVLTGFGSIDIKMNKTITRTGRGR